MKQYVCIGTYTEPVLFGTGEIFQGKGKGIYTGVLENGELKLLNELAVKNPSFLCIEERRNKIYAVNELAEYQGEAGGGVTQIGYAADGGLEEERTCGTGGIDPCHVVSSPDGRFLAVTNYTSGSLTVVELDGQGNICGRKAVFVHEGSSVHPARQSSAHAHSAVFSPDGRYLYVVDLGMDRIKAYSCAGQNVCEAPEADILVPAGSGPRTGVFSSDGHHFYLINEIGSCIIHFLYEDGKMIPRGSTGTLPPDFKGENTCADLHITPDGRFLYASNRGHDSLLCCRICADGALEPAGWQGCGGRTPRNFAISPDGRYLLAANQDSDNITVFAVEEDGGLTETGRCGIGSPVCIRFWGENS